MSKESSVIFLVAAINQWSKYAIALTGKYRIAQDFQIVSYRTFQIVSQYVTDLKMDIRRICVIWGEKSTWKVVVSFATHVFEPTIANYRAVYLRHYSIILLVEPSIITFLWKESATFLDILSPSEEVAASFFAFAPTVLFVLSFAPASFISLMMAGDFDISSN
ncbi:hypothetical protein OUZ56_009712 [Daphnia magna]|uniref:Uncharacterized protein n=1 Tax=Daphnia magna TaxID=35525 RepID=A0ABR0AH09_9CRUS|nr:hypothetical protein OUZ56_009712 [Daphnia magna]